MFMKIFLFLLMLSVFACKNASDTEDQGTSADTGEKSDSIENTTYQTTGSIQRLSPELDQIIPEEAQIEILADGFTWSEGPLWVEEQGILLFSDVPENKIYQWNEAEGLQVFLEPSGYTGTTARGGEPGSNGLILDAEGNLILCQHGDRRVALWEGDWRNPQPEFTTIVAAYEGKQFNSPNDVVMSSKGEFYFTDPPYGLEKQMDDPKKELDFQGVYHFSKTGEIHLITKELSRPNGIALSPDEQKLYVANSDPERALWMVYDLDEKGLAKSSEVLYDATEKVKDAPGLPDGMKVDRQGHLFATGPGGVWIFNAQGEHLGTIQTGVPTANCALDEKNKILYMTADNYLMRVKL